MVDVQHGAYARCQWQGRALLWYVPRNDRHGGNREPSGDRNQEGTRDGLAEAVVPLEYGLRDTYAAEQRGGLCRTV